MKKVEDYTIQELQEAIDGIDQEKYREKYSELQSELSKKMMEIQELNAQIVKLSGSTPLQGAMDESQNTFTFKRCFLACCCSIGLLWLLLGILGFFGFGTIIANGEQVHGISALVSAVFGGGISCLIFGFMVWLGEKALRIFEGA
ncbi:hypothetical protein ACJJH9_08235 [Microbulbifer sp. DLAB2-AF]|uniref:hypothetical protein n=1 Tax=Microbulbifer sp. DLAB2-AF TaxID=3243395 RepID=UPI0040398DBE